MVSNLWPVLYEQLGFSLNMAEHEATRKVVIISIVGARHPLRRPFKISTVYNGCDSVTLMSVLGKRDYFSSLGGISLAFTMAIETITSRGMHLTLQLSKDRHKLCDIKMYKPCFFAAQTNDSICSSSLDETSA